MSSPGSNSDSNNNQTPTVTSHMLTLGLDASDDCSSRLSVEMVDNYNEDETSSWWNRVFHSTDRELESRLGAASSREKERTRVAIDEVDTDYLYAQMNDRPSPIRSSDEAIESSSPQRKIQESFRKVAGVLNKFQKSVIRYPRMKRSLSDRSHIILRDGHFYYRDMESQASSLASRNYIQQHGHSSIGSRRETESHCTYFQAPSMIVDPELKRYREMFENLNKDVKYLQLDRLDECDLLLNSNETSEGKENQEHTRSSILRTVETSSLLYEVEGGGTTLLCLPRDHVRLVMDPELETGTLAVEQWRRGDETGNELGWSETRSCSFCPGCKKELKNFSTHPDLRYTLVVNDDLYRNLISELSSHLTEPYCGVNRWCLDDEKVDIRVAIGVLIIVFLLMFATTIVWPTQ